MNHRLARLAARRERLLNQGAADRLALAESLQPWRLPLAFADQGLGALRYIGSNPTWFAVGGLLLVALRPRNLGRWVGRALVMWQLFSRIRDRPRLPPGHSLAP